MAEYEGVYLGHQVYTYVNSYYIISTVVYALVSSPNVIVLTP